MSKKKSSKKHFRQSRKKNSYNNRYKSMIKTFIRKIHLAISNKDKEIAKNLYTSTQSIIDKCVKKRIIHKNKASRYKSKLLSKINSF